LYYDTLKILKSQDSYISNLSENNGQAKTWLDH